MKPSASVATDLVRVRFDPDDRGEWLAQLADDETLAGFKSAAKQGDRARAGTTTSMRRPPTRRELMKA